MRKKKIFIVLLSLLLMLGCLITSAEDTADVNFAWSIDGDIATVVVSVSGCDAAKSMMLTPVYDSDVLELQSGEWELAIARKAGIQIGCTKEDANAVLTFKSNTPINQDIFKMTFKVIGENAENALKDVKCRLKVKTLKDGKEVDFPVYVEGLEPEGCKHTKTQNVGATPAGCTTGGYTAGVYCNDCKEYVSGHVAVSPLGHKYETAWSYDVTGHWHKCSACGEKADSASHSPGAAATSSSPQLCTVCEYVIADRILETPSDPPWYYDPWDEPQDAQPPSVEDEPDKETTTAVTQPLEPETDQLAPETGQVDPETGQVDPETGQVDPELPTDGEPPVTEPPGAEVTEDKADETSPPESQPDETDKAKPSKPSSGYVPPIQYADDFEKSNSNSISIPILIVICGCPVIVIIVIVCLLNIKKQKLNKKRGKNDENTN